MLPRIKKYNNKFYIPVFILLAFLILNLPSILQSKRLSYDRKDPPTNISATWPQRQYLAQLWVNEGRISDYNHPTWKQTTEYLKNNGENSLPKGIMEGVLFNLKLTTTEFIKDLVYIGIYHTRTVSIMFLVGLLAVILRFKKDKEFYQTYFMPISTFAMILIFSLLIISFIELRWLGPVFLGSIVFYSELENKNQISLNLNKLNLHFLVGLTCYGIYGLLIKIGI